MIFRVFLKKPNECVFNSILLAEWMDPPSVKKFHRFLHLSNSFTFWTGWL
jgi:hypothetical protein